MTPDGKQEFRIQLMDAISQENIISAGGTAIITTAGSAVKLALTDKAGATLANPVSLTRGFLNFFVDIAVESVDVYLVAPGGQFVVAKGVKASGKNEIKVDTTRLEHVMVIPVAAADFTAGSANNTGFTEPANSVIGTPLVKVGTAEGSRTLDVGPSNDPNGYIAAASMAAATTLVGAGALIGTAGTAGNAIQVTPSASSASFEAFVQVPYQLSA